MNTHFEISTGITNILYIWTYLPRVNPLLSTRSGSAFFVFSMVCGLLGLVGCEALPRQSSLIEYRRVGGIVGFEDHLVILEDGTATLTRRQGQTEFSIPGTTLDQLITAFDTAKFSDLQNAYEATNGGVDLLEYTIRHKNHTVRTVDTAIPSSLQPIIDQLNQIISSLD